MSESPPSMDKILVDVLCRLSVTKNNTFLVISYGWYCHNLSDCFRRSQACVGDPVTTDLTSIGGTEDGWTFDCTFQELDAQGNVLVNFTTLEAGIMPDEVTWNGPGDENSWEERELGSVGCSFFQLILTVGAQHMITAT